MSTWTETGARSYARSEVLANSVLAPRERPDWMEDAACRGRSELFFPGAHGRVEVAAAKRICGTCPVQPQCLSYAIEYQEKDGVWGQTSGEERKRMRRQARRSAV